MFGKKKIEERYMIDMRKDDEPDTEQGARIAKAMEKIYLMVASVDIGSNSYYVECGGEDMWGELPRRGFYENLLTYLDERVDEDSKALLRRHWNRKALIAAFDETRTEISSILCVRGEDGPEYIQLRCERIPEASSSVRRYRGLIYLKAVSNQNDNGDTQHGLTLENKTFIGDPDLASLFDGIYELDIAGDRIYPYVKKDGHFARMQSSYSFSGQVDSYTRHGIISEQVRSRYLQLLDEDFLKKSIRDGQYMMEVELVAPGSRKALTYSEILVPIGRSRYRVYRNNIDRITQTKAQLQERQEQAKLNEYNQMMLITMAGLVEFRNNESGAHISHVSELVGIILTDISERSPHYRLNRSKIDMYITAAVLHDIGKIAIPDAILNKPGSLDEHEMEIMRGHTVKGAQIISRIHAKGQEEMLRCCYDVALHHHERYDGGGYPDGLRGDEIPIGVQAVSLADVFDALISDRVYKDAYTPQEAYRMILDGECGMFNPRLIETFKAVYDRMCDIYK